MTVFDFSQKEKVFEVEDGGKITLRTMTLDESERIEKAVTKVKEIFKKVEGVPARFEKVEFDEKKRNEMFWDFVIVDWEGFYDVNGIEIPCTKENKLKLLRTNEGARVIADCLERLKDAEKEQKELEEKN